MLSEDINDLALAGINIYMGTLLLLGLVLPAFGIVAGPCPHCCLRSNLLGAWLAIWNLICIGQALVLELL